MRSVESRYCSSARLGAATVFVLAVAVLIAHGLYQKAVADGISAAPEQVLAELDQANALRAEISREQSNWRQEQEKMELLLTTIRNQTRNCQAQASRDRKLRQQRLEEVTALGANQKRLADIETMLDTLCERVELSMEKLRSAHFPGLIPPDRAQGITDPAGRLALAIGRMEEAAGRCRNSSVELVVGLLGDQELTVKLLRAGGAAAWWVSLDGQQAGTAKMASGKLVLTRAIDMRDIQNINMAFNVIEGRVTPAWMLLPAGRLRPESIEKASK